HHLPSIVRYLLFFCGHRGLCYPHAFPTRRSSDLHYIAGLSWEVAFVIGGLFIVTGPTMILPLLRQSKLKPRPAKILKWEGIIVEDRKSTRLNSSHVSISYAVFCLKKQKEQIDIGS